MHIILQYPWKTFNDSISTLLSWNKTKREQNTKKNSLFFVLENFHIHTGRGLVKKVLVPFLLGLKFKTTVLLPLAFALIALKAWKALTLGLISLVVSTAVVVFKLAKPKVSWGWEYRTKKKLDTNSLKYFNDFQCEFFSFLQLFLHFHRGSVASLSPILHSKGYQLWTSPLSTSSSLRSSFGPFGASSCTLIGPSSLFGPPPSGPFRCSSTNWTCSYWTGPTCSYRPFSSTWSYRPLGSTWPYRPLDSTWPYRSLDSTRPSRPFGTARYRLSSSFVTLFP